MKSVYTKPVATIDEFKAANVVTTSIDDTQKGDNDINFGD